MVESFFVKMQVKAFLFYWYLFDNSTERIFFSKCKCNDKTVVQLQIISFFSFSHLWWSCCKSSQQLKPLIASAKKSIADVLQRSIYTCLESTNKRFECHSAFNNNRVSFFYLYDLFWRSRWTIHILRIDAVHTTPVLFVNKIRNYSASVQQVKRNDFKRDRSKYEQHGMESDDRKIKIQM